jgi:hypothetical protein
MDQKILEAALADQIAKALHSSLGSSAQPAFGVGNNRGPPAPSAPLVFTVSEFCSAHRISRSTLYELFRDGLGPRIFKVGSSVRITAEAAATWRAEREAAHSTTRKAKEAA